MLSGAEMVVRSLIDQGVKQVFGYPEAQCLIFMMRYIPLEGSIMCWCVMSRPRCIWRMAARATGDVGVVLVTSGPGATNAITGIATAYMDSIPLVILSGGRHLIDWL